MASCRWLPSLLLGNSLWRADNCGTPGTWKIDPLVVLLLNSRNSIGLGQGREHGSGCKLFGDRWSSFWLTGWHSALPELFGTPLTPFPSLCSQVQVFCWRLIQLLWLLPKIVLMTPGLPVLRYSAEVALRSCMFPSIIDTSWVSSSVMVAPPDDGSGHWKYFSNSKYAKIEFLFFSVNFFLCLAEAPGLPDPASLTLKFSEPSAWGFFPFTSCNSLTAVLCLRLISSCDSFSCCNSFFKLFSFNFLDVSRSVRFFWDFSNSSLWISLSFSCHCRSYRRLLITAACWDMVAFFWFKDGMCTATSS